MRYVKLLLASIGFFVSGSVQAGYIAAVWSDPSTIHILDDDLNSTFSFVTDPNPNGVATDGTVIYSGHFSPAEVVAYNFAGNELFRWGDASLSGLQGMTLVGSELAISTNGEIQFRNALTGALVRTITGDDITGTIEGLAYDGSLIWALGDDELFGIDPLTGDTIVAIPNAAADESFGGTGIATSGANLVLAGDSGNFFIVSKVDGSVIDSGNNGLAMFGLDETSVAAVPEPATLSMAGIGASIAVIGALRRRCQKTLAT